MTLKDGSETLITLFRSQVFHRDFRLAVLDLYWLLDVHLRRVNESIEVARQRIKDVLFNYTAEGVSKLYN